MCAHTTCTEECRDDRGEPPPAVRLGEHPAPPQQAQHAAADGGDEPGDLDVGRRRSRVEAQEVVLQLVGIGVEPPVGLPVSSMSRKSIRRWPGFASCAGRRSRESACAASSNASCSSTTR
jgi:hypothetical protein